MNDYISVFTFYDSPTIDISLLNTLLLFYYNSLVSFLFLILIINVIFRYDMPSFPFPILYYL